MALSGSFTSAGVGAVYTPAASNGSFNVNIGGTFTGAVFFLTQSLNNGAQALVFKPTGSPVMFAEPGGYIVNMPWTDGQPTPSYTLVCKSISAGSCSYLFSP